MTKKIYQTPQLRIVALHTEGLIAASDRIPVGSTPATPATKELESPWNCENWDTEK